MHARLPSDAIQPCGHAAGHRPAIRSDRFMERFEVTGDVHGGHEPSTMVIEVEVDTATQLEDVLAAEPDIVLLDNLDANSLRAAVAVRDAVSPNVVLEASGGVTLQNVGSIADTGVDRISVGAVTHSATCFDIGLDWRTT